MGFLEEAGRVLVWVFLAGREAEEGAYKGALSIR